MTNHLLTTNHLTKQYGRHKAVDDVSLHIRQGDIYGLIGRNGAGKTTILKIISGLAAPTEGGFSIFGKTGRDAAPCMSRIGTLIETPGLYPNMTAAENLKLKALAMGIRKKDEIPELLETVGLKDTGRKKVRNFSLGMKQRLGIALALVGDPDLVVLDEPINGLDPQGIAEIRETLFTLNRERHITFLISSHILEELSKIATRYGIIHDGVLLEELDREELLARCSERIELKTSDTRGACTVLEAMGITRYKVVDAGTIHIFERLDAGGEITMALAGKNIRTLGITVKNEDLEDYYLNLTGGERHV